jgi:hypothetical protein
VNWAPGREATVGRDEDVAASDHPITVRFKDSMSPGSCIAGLALD